MEERFLLAFKNALEIRVAVTITDEFRSYPEWDSLGHMSLIAMLDAEFGIQIENSVFEKMKTVQDVYNYVQLHLPK
jgi:acyl carrier protein